MAFEDLMQNEAFREAFQRWWDEDWSWAGLGKKRRRAFLGQYQPESPNTLQDYWRGEEMHLIPFAGRKWTRFHLPPFDRDGKPCHDGVWTGVRADCTEEIRKRLRAAKLPDDGVKLKFGKVPAGEYAELRGVVVPYDFVFLDDVEADIVADFGSAIFLGTPTFEKKCIVARFERATFARGAPFGGATFDRHAEFAGAMFAGHAEFGDAKFAGHAEFGGATFAGEARFNRATFAGEARFNRATFARDAWFNRATFVALARFNGATFEKFASFGGESAFKRGAWFDYATFRGDCDFSNREFEDTTSFAEARFRGVPEFHNAKLHPDTTFRNAVFRGDTGGGALPPARLSWFRSHVWSGLGEAERKKLAKVAREVTRRSLRPWLRWRFRLWPKGRWRALPFRLRSHPDLRGVRRAHDDDAEHYEIAYRHLRHLCAAIRSVEYEGLFHALELRAHRARTDTNPTARAASWLYAELSDYGRSMGRPLYGLALLWFVFAHFYLWTGRPPFGADAAGLEAGACRAAGSGPDWIAALIAAARQFVPSFFGVSSAANKPLWLRCAEAEYPLSYFAVGTLETVLFIALIALFLIALRRRFQLRQ